MGREPEVTEAEWLQGTDPKPIQAMIGTRSCEVRHCLPQEPVSNDNHVRQTLGRGTARSISGGVNDQAEGQALLSGRADSYGNLMRGVADALGTHLDARLEALYRLGEDLQRICVRKSLLDEGERVAEDALGSRPLSPPHQAADELTN
jgi:hypothetical protein